MNSARSKAGVQKLLEKYGVLMEFLM